MPFPPACRGKGYFRAPWECSRWPFPPACRGKGTFRAPPGGPTPSLFRRFWMPALAPRDCLYPLPVEEKAISGLPGNARDGLFPLPVEEKALSGPPQEAQHRPSSDDSGCQLWLLVIAFTPCLSRKRLFQGSLGMLAMAFSPCLSRKRFLFRGTLIPEPLNPTYPQTASLGGALNPH